MSKGYGLKDPMPPLAVRNALAIQCYRDLIYKYGTLTPLVIMDRYNTLLRRADGNIAKRGRPPKIKFISTDDYDKFISCNDPGDEN